ncbi:Arc family DNA-binding protein [Thermoactinospora rubra]|uniref:Arc family DNA-binding protein n=1 Tax=Thermoactinospora rubra TaxID=1088767 RepID=UPI000A118CAD
MIRITLRLPDDLHALVTAAAERDRRSLNAEILYLLEKGLSDDGRSAPEAAPPSAGRP